MSITAVLQKIITREQAGENWSVFCFHAGFYAPLFFAHALERLKRSGVPVVVLDLATLDAAQVVAELSMSFLGQHKVYWCGDISALDAAQKKFFISFFKEYRGPHQVMFFSDASLGKPESKGHEALCSLEVSLQIDQSSFGDLFTFLYPEAALDQDFIKQLFVAQAKISRDQACMVTQYMSVMGDASHEAVRGFLLRVVVPDRSLFVLSQHFFAKDKEVFFRLWKEVEPDFPPEFWIPYWSEQLWQASLFVMQVQELGPIGAKKGVTRLPFSFLQRDWKKYGVRELCAAHTFLYGVDFGLKNGYAEHGLELFLAQFLQGSFARK